MAAPITVSIHSDASEFPTEKRYDAGIIIKDLKRKLELITGAQHTTMKLTLVVDDKETVVDNDDKALCDYLSDKKTEIKLIVNDDHPSLILQDGDTPKFVISEDKYLQRPNNARNFIKEMREKRLSGQSSNDQSK